MHNYNTPEELKSLLNDSFFNHVRRNNVDAETYSGNGMYALISDAINIAITKDEIPVSFQSNEVLSDLHRNNLQQTFDSVIQLASQMAEDAITTGDASPRLHEWSLDKAKYALCPLYPFLREPCKKPNE